MKIKVCGMKYKDNIEELLTLKVNYIGFIFYDKSPRFAGVDLNTDYLNNNQSVSKTGVFVNSTIDNIIAKAENHKLNYIQLHGNESPDFCKELFDNNYKLIKAFQIDSNFDFNSTKKYKSSCSFFLFDTKTSDFGGSGAKFDWDILNYYDNEIPYFLSGGIDIESIDKIKSLSGKFNIHAIDINSKFEVEPGLKDIKKIKNFITLL
ncbi:MAG: phosphoribosylanthranilate isomerase [Bacteroidota bacterium]|nr:phosphoribosylanthranilate isomerase [Bacteroidota bacterium]